MLAEAAARRPAVERSSVSSHLPPEVELTVCFIMLPTQTFHFGSKQGATICSVIMYLLGLISF